MSTRSAIITRTPEGTYRGVYCHFDGYLEGVGHTLAAHYTDPEKVAALIDLGDLSALEDTLNDTVAYARDRDEDPADTAAIEGPTPEAVASDIGHNGHVYVFNGQAWTHNGAPINKRGVGPC